MNEFQEDKLKADLTPCLTQEDKLKADLTPCLTQEDKLKADLTPMPHWSVNMSIELSQSLILRYMLRSNELLGLM